MNLFELNNNNHAKLKRIRKTLKEKFSIDVAKLDIEKMETLHEQLAELDLSSMSEFDRDKHLFLREYINTSLTDYVETLKEKREKLYKELAK